MKAIEAFVDGLNILSVIVLYSLLWLITPKMPNPDPSGPKTNKLYDVLMRVSYIIIFLLGWIWCSNVMAHVDKPYLDEVFHIPQAQKFCDGRWDEWDDKITTPPGLYILSKYYLQIMMRPECSVLDLRGVNILAVLGVGILATHCRHLLETRRPDAASPAPPAVLSFHAVHLGWNVALFPVLFFFSGLYYTDVVSTLSVLVAYYHHLRRVREETSSFLSDWTTVVVGVLALLMRQTNVFWVVVYMGGLEAVAAVKALRPEPVARPIMSTLGDYVRFYAWRYSVGDVHDPPLNTAWPDDLFFSALSIGIAALANPLRVLKKVYPHITVMALFAGFVAWNGGVVLGDKSNHVATLHLAQMLYIWPLFAFFSFPLFLPSAIGLLRFLRGVFAAASGKNAASPAEPSPSTPSRKHTLPESAQTGSSKKQKTRAQDEPGLQIASAPTASSPFVNALQTLFSSKLYHLLLTPSLIVLTLAVIRLNTIIHPFTLADNRHYMFYVFRYTIRRPGLFRYYLVVPYTLARWLCWDTLGGCGQGGLLSDHTGDCSGRYTASRPGPFENSPFGNPAQRARAEKPPATEPLDEALGEQPARSGDAAADDANDSKAAKARYDPFAIVTLADPASQSTEPPASSTAVLLLLATTLSLMTAPLVEPRYFILPWVFWRILVPAWRLHGHGHAAAAHPALARLERLPVLGSLARFGKRFDVRLVLETLWFVLVNVVTMYIFLAKPYLWRSEDGRVLENGRMQRFMW
ncbi:DIE2/ALG10 family protein [Colletotrichum higginsianum IMI 349063]|uniref:Dol-P-Glc:Glc(2)Man(9)GlcNAc(2)-PP-Dol alpha-1,2-glucosyltransferase n=4 Tax=Colletotrichum higginsianum TaxID=80884 RepID=A0A1B7XRE8_COLHI|nr:DIE2/ALG10 family protein [Colletotrichum higginsianum IMI 349063]OBR02330.1 DIE2/ALG10 family protein [Colletotrichum higginsianum IMI 349063]TID07463.1 Dol-P-Glc:Glc(2)Man(9)GlcNAc(2)-PP-Dol alpha-1,2-glucosyltransferase [Colletotrichum higginsianum]